MMTEVERQQINDLRLKGTGYKAISAVLGMSRDTVRGFCKRNKIEFLEQDNNQFACPCCGQAITKKARGRSRRFCSDVCRRKWWADNYDSRSKKPEAIYSYTCLHCGKQFSAYGDKHRKYCRQKCYFLARF
jgi:endogenous inhibitor of DNA gyrase (YacG/DUF329 family)